MEKGLGKNLSSERFFPVIGINFYMGTGDKCRCFLYQFAYPQSISYIDFIEFCPVMKSAFVLVPVYFPPKNT